MYIPVYLLPLLLFKRKALATPAGATSALATLALRVARSSVFLAVFSSFSWGSYCAVRRVRTVHNRGLTNVSVVGR